MTIKTEHLCPHCSIVQPIAAFQKGSGWCRSCRTQKEKERRAAKGTPVSPRSVIVGDQKLCLQCNTMIDLGHFSDALRGLGGKAAYCKTCFAAKYKAPAAVVRKRTAAYRSRHPERHKAAHRIHQFNRKSSIAATSDGTVTDAFLREIYDTENCSYCQQTIPEHARTADHMTPLARGGSHSASNICMACFPCNSAKGRLTAAEFRKKTHDHFCTNYC